MLTKAFLLTWGVIGMLDYLTNPDKWRSNMFEHLKQYEVKEKTAEFTFHNIAGNPTFIVRPANSNNKAYLNSTLRGSRKSFRNIQSQGISSKLLEENREKDREEYPKSVIIGWKEVRDSKGNPVEFSKNNCQDYLNCLPDFLFDDLRNFCSNNENFIEEIPIEEIQE